MKNYRIGYPIDVRWSLVHTDSTPFPIGGYEAVLYYNTGRGMTKITDTAAIEKEGNVLVWHFGADAQKASGTYSLRLELFFQGSKIATFDKQYAFALNMCGIPTEGIEVLELTSVCDAISTEDATSQARRAMDLASKASIDSEEANTLSKKADRNSEQALATADDAHDKIGLAQIAAETSAESERRVAAALELLNEDQTEALALSTKVVDLDEEVAKMRIGNSKNLAQEPETIIEAKYAEPNGFHDSNTFNVYKYPIIPGARYFFSGRYGQSTTIHFVYFGDDTTPLVSAGYKGSWDSTVVYTEQLLTIPAGYTHIYFNVRAASVRYFSMFATGEPFTYSDIEAANTEILKIKGLLSSTANPVDYDEKIANKCFHLDGKFYDTSAMEMWKYAAQEGKVYLLSGRMGTDINVPFAAYADADGNIFKVDTYKGDGVNTILRNEILHIPEGTAYIYINVHSRLSPNYSLVQADPGKPTVVADLDVEGKIKSQLSYIKGKSEIQGTEASGFYQPSGVIKASANMKHTLYEIDADKKYVVDGVMLPNSGFYGVYLAVYFDAGMQPVGSQERMVGPCQYNNFTLTIPVGTAYVAINNHNNGVTTLSEATLGVYDGMMLKEALDNSSSGVAANTPIKVVKSAASINIRSSFSDTEDIIISFTPNGNNQFRPASTYLGSKGATDEELMAEGFRHSWSDSNSAALGYQTEAYWWMGAQHGYCTPRVTASGHGLTSADVNSVWRDQLNREYTVGKIEGNYLYLLPRIRRNGNKVTRDWVYKGGSNSEITLLKHISGSTHISDIACTDTARYDIFPAQDLVVENFYIDETPITEYGTYYGKEFRYSATTKLIDPERVTQWYPEVRANGYLNAHSVSYVVKGHSITYNTTVNILTPYFWNRYHHVQGQNFIKFGDYDGYISLPRIKKTINVDGQPVPMDGPFRHNSTSNPAFNIHRSASHLYDTDKMPERCISLLRNAEGDEKIGFVSGLSLVRGLTRDSQRNQLIAMQGSTSDNNDSICMSLAPDLNNKFYPRCLTGYQWPGHIVPDTFIGEFSGYFAYFNPKENPGTQTYWYKDGNDYIVYIHTQQAKAKWAINIDPIMEGLNAEIVDKTEGVSLLTDMVVNGRLYISTDTKNNYIVLKLK